MKGSIFRKLLTVYLAISLVSLGGLSVMISILLESELRTDKENELRKQAAHLTAIISDISVDYILSSDLKLLLKEELRSIDRIHHIRSAFIYQPDKLKKLGQIGLSDANPLLIQKMFQGEQLFFIGKSENGSQEMLTLGTPVIRDGNVLLILLLTMPSADLNQLNQAFQQNILIAFLISALMIWGMIYWISKRMVIPVNRLTGAAAKIADGHFHERVPVSGADEISRLAESFNAMAAKLDAIEQHRSRFIAEAAHELRTPLTTIMGTLRGMLDDTIPHDERQPFLNTAYEETQRLGRLVNDLLELARFEEKAADMKFEPTNLSELARQTVRSFQIPDRLERVTFIENIEPDVVVNGDGDRIRQVIVNLIANALEHNPEPLTITISLQLTGSSAVLSVRDNGRGIAAEHLPFLFDRFYKTDPSRSCRGSGLGLAICRSIIEQSNGTITVRSDGSGTAFQITFSVETAAALKYA